MKGKSETKIIKFIKIYLEIAVVSMPFIFVLGFVGSIVSFVKTGSQSTGLTIVGVPLLKATKKSVFGQTSDAIIAFVIGFALFALIWYTAKKFSDFIRNVFEDKFISQENGNILKLAGGLIACIGIIHGTRELFINIANMYNDTAVGAFERLLVLVIGLPFLILQPIFILGAFFYLLGIILLKAAAIKQENDLTI